jgi:hypothetical protein
LKTTKANYKAIEKYCHSIDWQIRRITADNPYGGYRSGFLVTNADNRSHRWDSLANFQLNCIDLNRGVDGFLR